VYLGGTSSARPFGTSILDGVDLDIEEPSTGSQFYPDFVDKLTSLWSGASKKYYLTAVPQCKFCLIALQHSYQVFSRWLYEAQAANVAMVKT